MRQIFYKKNAFIILLASVTMLFLLRTAIFADSRGGVEHDSGWYLGVARNLAERGIYASYTNTVGSEGAGIHTSIHDRPSIQDEAGFIYFPAGVTVGPGYIVPQAVIFKIFGIGWWQNRIWPFFCFGALFALIFYIVWSLGGNYAFAILSVFFWIVPQLYTQFAFEAFSEHIAVLYLLLSFSFLALFFSRQNRSWLLFAAGVAFALSFLTKNIMALTGAAFAALCVWDLKFYPGLLVVKLRRWAGFAMGFALAIGLFEIYRYWQLSSNFGHAAWIANNSEIQHVYHTGGSGIQLSNLDWNFVRAKARIWQDVGLKPSLFLWYLVLFSPFFLVKRLKKGRAVLFALLYAACATSLLWFLLFSSAGWTRHAWHTLVFAIMILAILIGSHFARLTKLGKIISIAVFCALSPWIFLKHKFNAEFILPETIAADWLRMRSEEGLQGLPSHPLFPLDEQQAFANFFESEVKQNARIYYMRGYLVAEMPPIVDRVFYPHVRYEHQQLRHPDGEKSYLILGPYQNGPFSYVGPEYFEQTASKFCKATVYSNPAYLLCELK